MQITDIIIERFGAQKGREITDIPPGVSVFVGPNEAGKSSISAFVCQMLFGFAAANRRNSYQPPGGSKPSGTLAIQIADEQYTISRTGNKARVSGAGVRYCDQEADHFISRLLGGNITAASYRSIFAFSLDQLASNRDTADNWDAFFGAGMGSDLQDLTDLRQFIVASNDSIFTPRGRKKKLNDCHKNYQAAAARWQQHSSNTGDFTRLQQQLKEGQKLVSKLTQEHSTQAEILTLLETRIASYSQLQQYQETCRQQKKTMPSSLNAGHMARLDELATEQQRLQRKESLLAQNYQELEHAGQALPQPDPEQRQSLEHALQKHPEQLQQAVQITELKQEISQLQAEITGRITRLGYTPEQLHLTDTTLQTEQLLQQIISRFESLAEQDLRAQTDLEHAQSESDKAEQEQIRITAVSSKFADLDPAEAPAISARIHRLSQALEASYQCANIKRQHQQNWRYDLLVVGFLVATSWLATQTIPPLVPQTLIAFCSLALAICYLAIFARAKTTRTKLAQAGYDPAPNQEAATLSKLHRQDERHRQYAAHREQLSRSGSEHASCAQETQRWGQKSAAIAQKISNCQNDYRTLLASKGLPLELDYHLAITYLHQIEHAQNIAAQKAYKQQQLAKKSSTQTAYYQALSQLLGPLPERNPDQLLTCARATLLLAEQAEKELKKHQNKLQEIQAEKTDISHTLLAISQEVADVLAAAKIKNTSYSQLKAAYQLRTQLAAKRQELELVLRTALGKQFPSDPEALPLLDHGKPYWQAKVQSQRGALQELARNLEQAKRHQHQLEERQSQLLAGARQGPKLEAELQAAQAELDHLARSWSQTAIMQAVLEQAAKIYREQNQPQVITAANKYIADITAGRHQQITCQPDRSLTLGNPALKLSRGTSEQLLLALRLGYIDTYPQNATALPLILDDILVNFDPKRAHAAQKALFKLAPKHQIIYLTCHPQAIANLPPEQVRYL